MSQQFTEDKIPRFVVGIDLGTTNSAVAWVDVLDGNRTVQTFLIPQFVAAGHVESRETLPSFHYQTSPEEAASPGLTLPWNTGPAASVVGYHAREQGKLTPGRVTESAKSWLCHAGVDRTAPILPWHGSENVSKYSPVEVSAAYLEHIHLAWNAAHPEFPLAEQDVILTLPASFDEVARELTIQAARKAGLPRVVLLEEPQAAFYSWIHRHEDCWDQRVTAGQKILVCDVGGGTTDFTLIRVRRQSDGSIQFHRTAVGDHLILGGDNFDLAIAQSVEKKLANSQRLEPRQWTSLVRLCRHAKETLLSEPAPESYSVSLPGSGKKLIGGALQIELNRDEIRTEVLAGFTPSVGLQDRPQTRQSGFQEFGLPYATDPAITRHLAWFLWSHRHAGADPDTAVSDLEAARPDIVLFNGGVFISPLVQQRIVESLSEWFGPLEPDWKPIVLENPRLDLAVAQGAAYYGLVRRGEGVRISAGLARSYYIGAGGLPPSAVCVMSAGAEPGAVIDLEQPQFELKVSAPVEFQLYYSGTRLTDRPGEILDVDDTQMTPLPPIRTVLKQRRKGDAETVPVRIQAGLDEIGLLQLSCLQTDGAHRWQLQFDVRAATQTEQFGHTGTGETSGVLDEESVQLARELLRDVFEKGEEKPGGLPKRLAEKLELPREDWPPTLLRQLWSILVELENGRHRSADHEARWLNLLGYCLRPGFGVALDDWRVAETWKLLRGKLVHPGPQCLSEWWILWRRVAGGLASGQQQALATPLISGLKEQLRKLQHSASRPESDRKRRPGKPQDEAESWRMLASLEMLPVSTKIELGRMAVSFLSQEPDGKLAPVLTWSVGRIGARQLFAGALNDVIPAEEAATWIDALMKTSPADSGTGFALMQLARKTGDRYRDLQESKRIQVIRWLEKHRFAERYLNLLREGGQFTTAEDTAMQFGEALPSGLTLRR